MGSDTEVKHPKLSFLISHSFLRNNKAFIELISSIAQFADVLIDSGAYTNHTQWIKSIKTGEPYDPITVEEYAKACQFYESHMWGYLTLDKINDPDLTWDQYNYLLDSGVQPIPIVQPGESEDRFSHYLDTSRNKRIAVGGIAGLTASNSLSFGLAYYRYLYGLSGKTARIHTLGVLKWPEIFQLEGVRYTDTTTYAGGARFGEITRYDEQEGFTKVRFRNPAHISAHRKLTRFYSYLNDCKITPELLSDPENYKGSFSIPGLVAIYAYLRWHRHAKSRDLTYFFAISGKHWISKILAVLNFAEAEHFDYPAAKELGIELNEIMKKDQPRAIELFMDILRRRTRWRMRTK